MKDFSNSINYKKTMETMVYNDGDDSIKEKKYWFLLKFLN